MTTKQITICGHSATVEERAKGFRWVFIFADKTHKGETIAVELARCTGNLMAKAWNKAGLTPTILPSWWDVDVQAEDKHGARIAYNPTINEAHKLDFSWVLEATDENAKRLLEEIARRAYGSEPTQPETATGSDAAEQLTSAPTSVCNTYIKNGILYSHYDGRKIGKIN